MVEHSCRFAVGVASWIAQRLESSMDGKCHDDLSLIIKDEEVLSAAQRLKPPCVVGRQTVKRSQHAKRFLSG